VRNDQHAAAAKTAIPGQAGSPEGGADEEVAPEHHRAWLGQRWITVAYAAFAAYAAVAAVTTGGLDQAWACWALPGYGAAALLLRFSRGKPERGWGPALLVAVALAVAVPFAWLSARGALTDGMVVIGRSAALLLRHGLPYFPAEQVSSWLSYNPYLPLMALFGMPKAVGLVGLAGDPGVWMALATVAVLAAAVWVTVPHGVAEKHGVIGKHDVMGKHGVSRDHGAAPCRECRLDIVRYTAFAVSSPVIALNLVVITTDPPVLALMLLSLALAARPAWAGRAGLVLGAACALKITAWPEGPVLAAMFWSRDGGRAAGRFMAASVGAAAALIAASAPALFTQPATIIQNAILFPLGLTRYKTPAESLLPGHLLASTGPAGHLLSVALVAAAAVAFLVSLVIRPPRGVRAAALRLALGLAVIFTVGPNDRFGYFVYPLGLFGWLLLTRGQSAVAASATRSRALAARRGHWAEPGAGTAWRHDAPAATGAGSGR
jgi:hypothetical protein